MNRQKLILKFILSLLLVTLLYVKFKHPNESWIVEIAINLGIVSILLGLAEIILRSLYLSLALFISPLKKSKPKFMNDGIKQLAVAVLLLTAGIISPSNGIDDKIDRSPLHIFNVAVLIMMAAAGSYLIIRNFNEMKEANKNHSEEF